MQYLGCNVRPDYMRPDPARRQTSKGGSPAPPHGRWDPNRCSSSGVSGRPGHRTTGHSVET